MQSHGARPAVTRAESPTGFIERVLEIERVIRMRLAIAGADLVLLPVWFLSQPTAPTVEATT
jgi:hypothetical protein